MNQAREVQPDFAKFRILASRGIESLIQQLCLEDSLDELDRFLGLTVLADNN